MARRRRTQQETLPLGTQPTIDAPLAEEARKRYLHYALSVITSRALPDVRDGLKPVQRRILYTMYNDLRLRADAKPVKCARIVGEVMGSYHPHGNDAIYEALARQAQDFVMRVPLVDGKGNFGSVDGDPPAAMRYTEARLHKAAEYLLAELEKRTVPTRPNYDGTRHEPTVLPAKYPNLLVNGAQGIAVGMATSIPPHNLSEVVAAAVALIDDPELSLRKLLLKVKGPDLPTGGELLATRDELAAAYEVGQGTFKMRGEWTLEERSRGAKAIVITSIPYAVERSTVVTRIADVIIARKLPPLVDVRDESTDSCRVVLELKKDADPRLVMAYLYKHTPLQSTLSFNLTCLIPGPTPESPPRPDRVGLRDMLRHFLDFRFQVVTRRLEYELELLRRRIHILEGFERIFDDLDTAIRLIRASDGRKDAGVKLKKRFALDDEQCTAILDMRLYKLARLEIDAIRKELAEKRAEADRIAKLLSSSKALWALVRAELCEVRDELGTLRKTRILGDVDEPSFELEDFIVAEDGVVVLTQQGWVKRQQQVRDTSTTRLREGDRVLELAFGSTRAAVAFFSSQGSAYVCRIADVPATTGYGFPVQKLFKLADGERIVAMSSFDPRVMDLAGEQAELSAVAVSKQGMCLRFPLAAHGEPSTRNGRRFMRLRAGDEVIHVEPCVDEDVAACVTREGHALLCQAEEISVLGGPGLGVRLIKLGVGDQVIAARLLEDGNDSLLVESDGGKRFNISTKRYAITGRGGKGKLLLKNGHIETVIEVEPTIPGAPAPVEAAP